MKRHKEWRVSMDDQEFLLTNEEYYHFMRNTENLKFGFKGAKVERIIVLR